MTKTRALALELRLFADARIEVFDLAELEREEVFALGHLVSFTGIITFKNAAVAQESIRRDVRIPLERAALLSLGRAGGALTRRSAAFLEGWIPGPE